MKERKVVTSFVLTIILFVLMLSNKSKDEYLFRRIRPEDTF